MNASAIRVMLVDDHQVVRRGIRDFFEEEPDIEVVAEAENAAQAYTLIQQLQPDVIVLDIKMPGESGIELAKRLRQDHVSSGILILSAYDDDPYIWAAVEAGVNGYVIKSADRDTLVEAVRTVYEGKQVFEAVQGQIQANSAASTPQTEPAAESLLTQRETEILRLAARGLTNKSIAYQLTISDRTVQTHLTNIYRKLDVTGRTEMTLCALSCGLIASDNL